jgi:RNA polymerase sigma-70 factor (ECF subfamily)
MQAIIKNGEKQNTKFHENQLLEDAIQQLRPEQKTLILLRFNQNMNILEISKTLDIPEGTVKSRLHRTLNQLKNLITGDEHEY